MLSLLLISTYQKPIIDKDKIFQDILQLEDKPSFVEKTKQDTSTFAAHFNRDTSLSGQKANMHREYTFFKCSIVISGETTFESNYAFGSGRTSGSGGALHICQCVLSTEGNQIKFKKNMASVGGGICSVSSAVLIDSLKFIENQAFKFGGGIYFQGAFMKGQNYLSPSVTFIASNSQFILNKASEIGGGLAISFGLELYLESCKFFRNQCSLSGGAISSANCDSLKLIKCGFIENSVNAKADYFMSGRLKKDVSKSDSDPEQLMFPSHEKGRGGGAISFVSDSKKGNLPTGPSTYQRRVVESHGCCFCDDSATNMGMSFGSGSGHEILLEGYCVWKSYQDIMKYIDNIDSFDAGFSNNQVSIVKNKEFRNDAAFYQLLEFKGSKTSDSDVCNPPDRDGSEDYATVITTRDSEYIPSAVTPSPDNGNEDGTTSVPSPSNYTYVATPITRFPKATTSSHYPTPIRQIGNETGFNFSAVFSGLSPPANFPSGGQVSFPEAGGLRTMFQTPHSTPHSTAHSTPHSTPNDTPIPARTTPQTPHILKTPGSGQRYSTTTNSTIVTITITISRLQPGDDYWNGSSYVKVTKEGDYPVAAPINIQTEVGFGLIDITPESTKNNKNMFLYIGIGAGLLLLILIAAIIAFVILHKRNEDSSTSAVEMAEETVMQVPDSTSAPVTNDNPLWTTSVMGDTDDPFKNDFEEDGAQGFFGIAHRPDLE